MKILVICYMGMNRSQYLSNFLTEQGFFSDYAGILPESRNLVTQEKVDDSNILIFALPRIREKFLQQFKVANQKIITLNVEDRLEILCPEEPNHTPEQAKEIYERLVYPELRKQISKYIPLLSGLI